MTILRPLAGCLLAAQLLAVAGQAPAHETRPAVADLTIAPAQVTLRLTMPLEPVLAGIDLGAVSDTRHSPLSARHDALRALPGGALEARARAAWPALSGLVRLTAGGTALPLRLQGIDVPDDVPPTLARDADLTLTAELPRGRAPVTFAWAPRLGPLIVRRTGGDGYTGYLAGGAATPPLARDGGAARAGLASYVGAGYRHIIPLGADHILFVLGLFFYSTRLRPLLGQLTAFTLAHTLTLGLATFGLVDLPGGVVEPLVAASIIWIAVENVQRGGTAPSRAQTRRRLAVVTGFGLLHGLGFAAMLTRIGLPAGAKVAALAAFNVGLELGQLAVIALAFALVGLWYRAKPWYSARIARPASTLIGLAGGYWLASALA